MNIILFAMTVIILITIPSMVYILIKLNKHQQINNDIIRKNNELFNKSKELQNEIDKLDNEHTALLIKRDSILTSISDLEQQAEQTSNSLFKKSMEIANEKMDNASNEISKKYKKAEQEAQQEYTNILKDLQINLKSTQSEIIQSEKQLQNLKNQIKAAVAAETREKAIQEKPEDYIINISLLDIEDIKQLNIIKKQLHNPRVLSMLIWQNYIKTPLDSLCDKVFGNNQKCGIYKITNRITNEIYIGQSVNLKERMRQHFKRGLGIDTPVNNKLYKNLQEYGVWNFSIELLEECIKEQLDEKEKYYIDLYESNYSLNSTKGNN